MVADARDLDLVVRERLRRARAGRAGRSACQAHEPVAAGDFADDHPALIVFTSGTAGEPKPIRHGHGYLSGQSVQAEHWYGARPGELCWCTAASGWSLSARNAFVAAWLRGAAALLHDARFDPEERLELLDRERVNVLCMSPTEYRAIAKRVHASAARRAPACLRRRRAAQPRGGARVAGGRGRVGARRLRPDGDRPPDGDADRPAGAARLDGQAAARLPRLDRRRRAGGGPRDRAHLLPRRRRATPVAHRRPRARGRRRLPLVRGPDRRRDHLGRLPDRPVRGGVGARLPPRGGRGRRGGGARRGARPGRPRGRRAARRLRARRRWRPSSRST